MIYEKEKRYIIPFEDVPSPRAEMPEISIDERKGNFTEVETGFPRDIAVKEAKRCLSCRRCLGCALCWAECKPEAIDFDIPDEESEQEFDEVILTSGQENQFHTFSHDLGYGGYPEVITDLQFERMLSASGPTDGLVVSPADGVIPQRLAILQGNAEEDEEHLLSSVVLGVNEAVLALSKTEGLQVTLVSPVCEAFKDNFAGEAAEIKGLKIVDGLPVSVARAAEGEQLSITYKDGGREKTEKFDMAVVLTKPKPAPEILSLSKQLEVEIR
jgi:heterodisulfide reductase subunit A-like polyferredoxin